MAYAGILALISSTYTKRSPVRQSLSSVVWHISTLAGWIPEHIEIKRCGWNITLFLCWPIYSSTFEREKTWERIEKGFSAGEDAWSFVFYDLIYLRAMRCDARNWSCSLRSMEGYPLPSIPQLCRNRYLRALHSCRRMDLTKNRCVRDRGRPTVNGSRFLGSFQRRPKWTFEYVHWFLFTYPHFAYINRSAPDTLVRSPKHLWWDLSQLGPQNVGEAVDLSWVNIPISNSWCQLLLITCLKGCGSEVKTTGMVCLGFMENQSPG